ncbi:MAG: hypothetical protein AUJ28_02425 [Parcubacteria group bacterium CG1_02_37_51]|uniref:Glutamyl-tRNA amidotransferase n=2 Tax=Candidatus Komeiliibacteriota TaxID=1817908 RepID=A0A2M8DSA4_9BACT|nr:MAG: hypothetical protein AUJ28_02425 [Parcubacteria group bacterium CG1_02_37_51]PIY94230.1 MAG: glutamyl-tRNA amidotransferase [Candidatus Komeilibacteria bacterium CG_4_10_14_0_8_um_filter_37_78]PJC02263.1 MAG: glutamyl-tRNA amidotransferase [Candidatus Komeilibacteria bacterium CG_4_9_14_0_8_um_filter_36_9]
MTLYQQIEADRMIAMKASDELRLSTLRMISTVMKNAMIAKKGELTDEEVQKILRTEVKKRKEAHEAFLKADYQDKAAQEKTEMAMIEAYLPAQMSDQDLEQLVSKTLQAANMSEPSQFGQAMGVVMKELAGQADGAKVQSLIKKILNT